MLLALAGFVALVERADAAEPKVAADAAQPAVPSTEDANAVTDDGVELDPDAVEVLKDMVKALADAQALKVVVDEEYDALQSDGETFSFGKTAEMLLRRPDRFRIDAIERNGAHRISSYDGKQIVVFNAIGNAYATQPFSGDVEAVLDYLRDDLGVKMPLATLFSPQLGPLLLEGVTTATYVDEETLDGVPLDHVAFQYGDGIGVQLWIPQTGDALPNRMIMTFEDAPGKPQFRANFRKWDLKPNVKDSVFAFEAPAGARALPFVIPKRRTTSPTTGEVAK